MSEVKSQVLLWAGRIVKYAALASLSDRFGYGKVAGPQEDPSQGDKSSAQPVRFMQWFGFRSRPVVKGGEAVVVAPRGGPSNAVAVAADNLSVGPTDLKEGEAVVYGKEGQVLRQAQDGRTTIDAASGKDIVLNGGTHKIARVGDHAKVTIRSTYTVVTMTPPTFALTVSAVSGTSVTTLFSFSAVGAVTVPTAPGVPYDVEVDSEIFEGADHALA